MMPSLIQNPQRSYSPIHTREQAIVLLQELRHLYRSLSLYEREGIKSQLTSLASAQLGTESKES